MDEKACKDAAAEVLYEEFGLDLSIAAIRDFRRGIRNTVFMACWQNEKLVVKARRASDNLLFYEAHGLRWEARAAELLRAEELPVPAVYCFRENVLDGVDVLLTEYIGGTNAMECGARTNRANSKIDYQLGKLCRKVNDLKANCFSFPNIDGYSYTSAYNFTISQFCALLNDADRYCPSICGLIERAIVAVRDNAWCFDDAIEPHLVLQDLWYGNVLIEGERIAGIVDFESALFGDPLMTYIFYGSSKQCSEDFLKGYNKYEITKKESARLSVYRVMQFIRLLIEGHARNRADDPSTGWIYPRLHEELNLIEEGTFGRESWI